MLTFGGGRMSVAPATKKIRSPPKVSGRRAKHRALAAARLRGSAGPLCQTDLDAAVTCVGPMARVDPGLRRRFQQLAVDQLVAVAAERGFALDPATCDHVHRSLARVAVRRALELSHFLTIEGREYRRCSLARTA